MALILDGKKVRAEIAIELRAEIAKLKRPPRLLIIQVGDRPESTLYIKQKLKWAEQIGAVGELKQYPVTISESDLLAEMAKFNNDPGITGLIVQLPLPESLNRIRI